LFAECSSEGLKQSSSDILVENWQAAAAGSSNNNRTYIVVNKGHLDGEAESGALFLV
jgi:hypothetical protein